MSSTTEQINKIYGEKLRIRVCGVLVKGNELLLVHHKSLGKNGSLWAPPGGGMEYGEDAKDALKREFLEETGLQISVEEFLFVHEYLDPPLHGIELFFLVKETGGKIKLGKDPEMSQENQILTKLGFYDIEQLKCENKESLHYVLQSVNGIEELINLKGYFKFH